MMDYEVFKTVVQQRIKEFLPPLFHNCRIRINTIHKVNEEKDALLVIPAEKGEVVAVPNIYLDEMYGHFRASQDMEKVLSLIAAVIIQYTGSFARAEADVDFREKKDSIVMNLISTERNRRLLATVPHREIMDLSVIYRIIMGQQGDGLATVVVSNSMLSELELTSEELDQTAIANTERLFPMEIIRLSANLYILTNEAKLHGATAMLYKQAGRQMARTIGGDFYLLPSSIHEVLAVPAAESDVQRLIRLLAEGNRSFGPEKEVLSNSIYRYDSDKDAFTVAATYHEQESGVSYCQ